MKKKLISVLCMILVCTLALAPMAASAAEEGNSVFVDTLEENFPLVLEKTEGMAYEKNLDTEKTLYEKISATGDPLGTEYVVYKLDDSVVGFSVDCMHVNGLGDPATDVSVFVSADGVEWIEVETACSELTYDDDLYVNQDMAYWLLSTVTNKAPIEQGYTYIKVQLNPYTNEGAVVWDTVMDTITVEYGPTMASAAPEAPAEEPTEAPADEPTPTEAPTVPTEAAPALPQAEKSASPVIWIVLAVVALGAIVTAVIVKKNKK